MNKFYLIFLLGFASSLQAAILVGQVVGVTDGDTITVLDAAKTQYKIRLAGIDAPEKKQAFGQVSKKSLFDFVFEKVVSVTMKKIRQCLVTYKGKKSPHCKMTFYSYGQLYSLGCPI